MSRRLVWGAAMLVAALGTDLLVAVDSADAQLFGRLRARRCCYVQTCRPVNYCVQPACAPCETVACAEPASVATGCVTTASTGCDPCATPCAAPCDPCGSPQCCQCVTRYRPILRTCTVRCRPVGCVPCVRGTGCPAVGCGVETTVIEEAPVEAPSETVDISPEA
jgi:hypothetical protein